MKLTTRSVFFSLTCALLAVVGIVAQQPLGAAIVILGTAAYFAVLRIQAAPARSAP